MSKSEVIAKNVSIGCCAILGICVIGPLVLDGVADYVMGPSHTVEKTVKSPDGKFAFAEVTFDMGATTRAVRHFALGRFDDDPLKYERFYRSEWLAEYSTRWDSNHELTLTVSEGKKRVVSKSIEVGRDEWVLVNVYIPSDWPSP